MTGTRHPSHEAESAAYILRLPPVPPASSRPDISAYVHTPDNPVLDREAALFSLTMNGRPGSAIADGDLVRLVDTTTRRLVTAVDHHTGQITVTDDRAAISTLPGTDVDVVTRAKHPPVPDDLLEQLTLPEARARMAVIASDYGRYPQYTATYFAGWVFGRVATDIHWRGDPHAPVDFPAGQRVLVRPDNRPVYGMSRPHTMTAYSTRRSRHGEAIAVWPHQIHLEA
ncbi:hypothetical protein ABZ570_03720 [Micromonospora sp. NPDC007271]|uniref:hypothetical protein n=1 Tax=Micromonospora sp. NPDC007271 TaxID=3154587 RepID=UPI0033E08594